MGYSSEWGKNAAQGGPFLVGKKNPRPQSYTGKYTSDGKAYLGSQAPRAELPPAKKSGDAVTDEAGGDDVSFNSILKSWR